MKITKFQHLPSDRIHERIEESCRLINVVLLWIVCYAYSRESHEKTYRKKHVQDLGKDTSAFCLYIILEEG